LHRRRAAGRGSGPANTRQPMEAAQRAHSRWKVCPRTEWAV